MRKVQCVSFYYICQVFFLSFILSGHCLADEVRLTNGDSLTGKILEIKEGILTLETSYSEPVKLKFEAVQKMSSSEPVELHLTDGEILKGKITTDEEGHVEVAAGPGKQTVTVALGTIASLNPPPKKTATWQGNVTLGGNRQDGNSDSMNVSAGALAVRRTENDRFLINILYNRSEDNGKRTAENAYGQMKYDYFLTPKWYLYMNIDMLADDFQDINLRTSVGPGVGYQVWDAEDRKLGLEAGLSYINEDRNEGKDNDSIAGRLGMNFLYRLFDRVIFIDQLAIYPNLDETGEYTLRNEAALLTDIKANWALKISNIWDRNSDPESNLDKDDFTSILGLQYTF